MHVVTSEARDVDVTGSPMLSQTTLRGDTSLRSVPSRTSPAVPAPDAPASVGGGAPSNHPWTNNYSPMIGLRWEYSPMVGIKIAAVLGGFFLLFAVYHTLKGVAKCSKQEDEDDDDTSEEEEEDGKRSQEELEAVDSRPDWELVFAKPVVDDTVKPEMRPFSPHPLSQNLGRLQCAVEIPDWEEEEEEDRNCDGTNSRTCT